MERCLFGPGRNLLRFKTCVDTDGCGIDAALVAQICDVLKQAAIEEGQWTEKRVAKGSVGMSEIMARLNAGRKRVADAKAARDAAA